MFPYVGRNQNLKDLKDCDAPKGSASASSWLELLLQLKDTMSLIKADLGLVCVAS